MNNIFKMIHYILQHKFKIFFLLILISVYNIIFIKNISINAESVFTLLLANIEILIIFYLLFSLIYFSKPVYCINIIVLCFSIIIIIAQLYSIGYTGCYIPAIGFDNIENLDLIFSSKSLFIICFLFLLAYIFAIVLYDKIKKTKSKTDLKQLKIKLTTMLLLYFIIICSAYYANIYSPISSFISELYLSKKSSHYTYNIDYAKNNISIIKKQVYQSNISFFKKVEKPNIILLIPDGVPSRLINRYISLWNKEQINKLTFYDVTPNIDAFMNESMVVDNYYNNLFATYPGLYGLFTSIFPYQNMSPDYTKKIRDGEYDIPEVASLIDILSINGYESYFIDANTDRPSVSFMLEKILGVQNVYNTSNISEIADVEQFSTEKYILDQDIFKSIKNILQNKSEEPKIIISYLMGTHLNFDPKKGINGKVYKDHSNIFLSQMYNFDFYFGEFMKWFKESEYHDNTIVILTTDHTHYPDNEYKELISKNKMISEGFFPCPYDKIPLIIYTNNIINLPKYLDANGRTSLNFAPTLLHILGYKNYRNSFMGTSLFDSSLEPNISGYINHILYYLDNGTLNEIRKPIEKNAPEKYIKIINKIQYYMKLQEENKLFDGVYINR